MGFFDWMSANSSNILQASSAGLDFYGSYQNSKIEQYQGKLNETLAEIEADSLRRKATMTENMGVHGAQAESYKGRVALSDATAAMAAGGGTVDPEMLARIKQRADYNAMSAVYDARVTAIGLREQASMASIGGRMSRSYSESKASDMRGSAISTALTDWPTSWSQSPKPPKTKPSGMGSGGTFNIVKGTTRGHVGGF